MHQIYNEWISQTIRLYEDSTHAEFEWQVGPIEIHDDPKHGKEVIMRFTSDLKSARTFYTDSNAREVLQRQLALTPTQAVAGNYYPINSLLFVRDENSSKMRRQLTLVNDRSQGGSSLREGEVELMLHRRLLHDDMLGVGEPLNETVLEGKGLVVTGIVSLVFETVETSAKVYRELAHRINNRPLQVFSLSNDKVNFADFRSRLATSLPPNLHLLTFKKEFYENDEQINSMIVRIEHFYEKGEDQTLSQPVTISFGDVFRDLIGVDELALGANMLADELGERLKWRSTDDAENVEQHQVKEQQSNDFTFTFNPMQIRTFRIFLKH